MHLLRRLHCYNSSWKDWYLIELMLFGFPTIFAYGAKVFQDKLHLECHSAVK